MSTSTKKTGRPSKPKEVIEPVMEPEEISDIVDVKVEPEFDGPKCPNCGRHTERSTKLLKRYELNAIRCTPCNNVSIEGTGEWYDILTAMSGSPPTIVVLAMAIYVKKKNVNPPPPLIKDAGHEAKSSEWGDERWNEIEY